MSSIQRLVSQYAFNPKWAASKMLFLAGPRQIGKTYLAKKQLAAEKCPELYYNFDISDVSDRFRKDPYFFESEARNLGLKRPWVVLDEIHKRSKWKNELKGIYDRLIDSFNLVVTGSARLDLLRTTGESLAGRYFLFHVHPIGLQEYLGQLDHRVPFSNLDELMERLEGTKASYEAIETLLELGGFPDPLSQGDKAYRTKWAMDYRRLILREDLKDLSRIMEIDRVEKLWGLLPERVGSPLSVRSLQEDLQASHEAISTWILNLEKLFSIYALKPYSKKIARSIKKEKKVYLMDWAIHEDPSKRFENFVISSLFRSTSIWTDSGQGDFKVWYVRNARSQEADFLVTRNDKPWFLGDVKLSSTSIDSHIYSMSEQLGGIPVVQVVQKTGIFQRPTTNSLVISADRLLMVLP